MYPANNYIIISFSVKQQEFCKLVITDLSGRIILTKQIFANAGDNQYPVNLDWLSNGIYIVRLTNTANTLVKRIALD